MKGLCVVKKVIQYAKNDTFQLNIRNLIAENALGLVHNPYGNYAIQTALDVSVILIKIFIFSEFHFFKYLNFKKVLQ